MEDTPGTGWVRDFPDPRDLTVHHDRVRAFKLADDALPSSHTIPRLPPIVNQGHIGSCTACAVLGMYQTYVLQTGKMPEQPSRLFTYKTSRNLLGWKGDTGAYLRTAMQSLALFGSLPERYFTYREQNVDVEPESFHYSIAQSYQSLTYYRLDPIGKEAAKVLESVKRNLTANRACVFGIVLFNNVDAHNADIPMPGPHDGNRGGHAMFAVGYNDDKAIGGSRGAFRVANSWGEAMGDRGFFWLPYDYVLKGLMTDIWTMMSAEWIDLGVFT